MEQQPDPSTADLPSKRLLTLMALVLGFVTLLILIWLWYNIRLIALDQQLQQKQANVPVKSTTNPR